MRAPLPRPLAALALILSACATLDAPEDNSLFVPPTLQRGDAPASMTPPAPLASPAHFHVLRLRPGQDLKVELQAFAKTHSLQAAFLTSAVGSLTDVHLRYANQDNGTRLTGHFEILSLSGTLAADGMHVHLSVADSTGRVTGGHLLDGNRVYTTAELVIGEATDLRFEREVDTTYGYRELTTRPR